MVIWGRFRSFFFLPFLILVYSLLSRNRSCSQPLSLFTCLFRHIDAGGAGGAGGASGGGRALYAGNVGGHARCGGFGGWYDLCVGDDGGHARCVLDVVNAMRHVMEVVEAVLCVIWYCWRR